MALVITIFIIFLQEACGYYPFGHDPRVVKHISFDPNSHTNDVPAVKGDEHITYYRGHNIVDMNYFGKPTSKTPEGK